MFAADPATVLFATALATAATGAIVSALAFQGYRRNESAAMLFLAIGIFCITVSPFAVSYGVALVVEITEATAMLGILAGNILGLLSILYSLEGT